MAINTESVLRRNRHNMHTGGWYGPDPEPNKPGPKCICAACDMTYPHKKEKAMKVRKYAVGDLIIVKGSIFRIAAWKKWGSFEPELQMEYVGEASVKGDKNGDD